MADSSVGLNPNKWVLLLPYLICTVFQSQIALAVESAISPAILPPSYLGPLASQLGKCKSHQRNWSLKDRDNGFRSNLDGVLTNAGVNMNSSNRPCVLVIGDVGGHSINLMDQIESRWGGVGSVDLGAGTDNPEGRARQCDQIGDAMKNTEGKLFQQDKNVANIYYFGWDSENIDPQKPTPKQYIPNPENFKKCRVIAVTESPGSPTMSSRDYCAQGGQAGDGSPESEFIKNLCKINPPKVVSNVDPGDGMTRNGLTMPRNSGFQGQPVF